MKRIITTAAAALVMAGPALAATDYVNNGVIPPREYEVESVGPAQGADDRTVVMTDKVFDPANAALIDQPEVNQYIFEDEGREASSGNYKSPEARYR